MLDIKVNRERKWLRHRGKSNMIEFDDKLMKKLKETFKALDTDGGGSIGLEELETPLIGLGLACNSEEI